MFSRWPRWSRNLSSKIVFLNLRQKVSESKIKWWNCLKFAQKSFEKLSRSPKSTTWTWPSPLQNSHYCDLVSLPFPTVKVARFGFVFGFSSSDTSNMVGRDRCVRFSFASDDFFLPINVTEATYKYYEVVGLICPPTVGPTFRGSEIFMSCSGKTKIGSVKTFLMKLGPWTRFILYFPEKKICEILIFFRPFLLPKLLGAPIWHVGKWPKYSWDDDFLSLLSGICVSNLITCVARQYVYRILLCA